MATKRESSAMRKMSPRQKRAFRKMIAARHGRKRARRVRRKRYAFNAGGTVSRRRVSRRKGSSSGRNITVRVITANPGGKTMPYAVVANPRRRRRRRRARGRGRRRYTTRARRPRRRRLRRAGVVRVRAGRRRGRGRRRYVTRRLYAYNPRRRRRSYRRNPGRRSYRRNPGLFASLKHAFTPYAAGFVMSMITSVTDTALAKMPAVKGLSKVGLAILTAMFLGRRYPNAAAGAIGALAASTGYEMGTKLAGGFIARTPEEAQNGLAAMYDDYPVEVGALLQGLGVLTGVDPVEPAVAAYESALTAMGDDDDY